ncbi:phosphotransferase enzyme family protein [Deinococcus enclensis]|uniref:Ser/Thr protein kinase RdoA (MazF antagonist) n=1 Tax=Deinococcus enclensis TaxID=1049582 RepID=A0ABT9MGF8_9DEIO|nr:phosphotransferase [Deinococcus enclensis]MDP9765668.1 Ser/Thr protein kinase RdoA (MazF antagonist) [Deinococcus enclensis]
MTGAPPPDVLERLNIRAGETLGGRVNRHWRVTCGGAPLVLRRWGAGWADVEYERALRAQVAALGWPAARDVSEVVESGGALWSLAEWRPGKPRGRSPAEARARGRLMADFHEATRSLPLGPRPGWRDTPAILADPALDRAFGQAAPDEARLLLWHLHRARALLAQVDTAGLPQQPVHGDFTPWNLLYRGGRLSGVLDFELGRPAWRVAEFALAWRGEHDEVLRGYAEVSPLSEAEWALITPVWWALLLEGAFRDLRAGRQDGGWTARMLRRRSALLPVDRYTGSGQ